MVVSTFSLVARDPETEDLGLTRAIATQSYANPRLGPQGYLRGSLLDEEVLAYLKERYG